MHPALVWGIKNWKLVLGVAGALYAFGHITLLKYQNNNLRNDLVAERFAKDSVEAVNDTTRQRMLETIGSVSLYYERRIVQTELERDSLDQELRQESMSRASIEARIDSLQNEVHSDTSFVSQDTSYAEFNFYEEPYTVSADVSIPPPPDPADLSIDINLDSIPFNIRVGCSVDGEIRRATLGVVGPRWADVEIQDVRQEPSVCNPETILSKRGWFDRNRGKLGIATGVIGTVATFLYFK